VHPGLKRKSVSTRHYACGTGNVNTEGKGREVLFGQRIEQRKKRYQGKKRIIEKGGKVVYESREGGKGHLQRKEKVKSYWG